jgi:hypothetical protein
MKRRISLDRELRIKELEEYVGSFAAGGCCDGCRTGSADCDVNPFAQPPTLEEAKAELARLIEERTS